MVRSTSWSCRRSSRTSSSGGHTHDEGAGDQVTSLARLIPFESWAPGCSDPVSGPRTLEERSDEIKAVMDAVGCERPVLFGLSEGGPSSIVFAATHPGQVQALVLFGTYAYPIADFDAPADQIRAELAKEGIAERYWPTDPQLERIAAFQRKIVENWGEGEALALLVPHQGDAQQQAMAERLCASPGMARATMESAAMIDIRDVLPTVNVPTLVFTPTRTSSRSRRVATSPTTSRGRDFLKVKGETTRRG